MEVVALQADDIHVRHEMRPIFSLTVSTIKYPRSRVDHDVHIRCLLLIVLMVLSFERTSISLLDGQDRWHRWRRWPCQADYRGLYKRKQVPTIFVFAIFRKPQHHSQNTCSVSREIIPINRRTLGELSRDNSLIGPRETCF